MTDKLLWQGKSIDALTNDEVFAAVKTVRETQDNYLKKRAEMQQKSVNADHRFNKMFRNELPPINPLFASLRDALENEMKKRTGAK
jgi:hypothetical protein